MAINKDDIQFLGTVLLFAVLLIGIFWRDSVRARHSAELARLRMAVEIYSAQAGRNQD